MKKQITSFFVLSTLLVVWYLIRDPLSIDTKESLSETIITPKMENSKKNISKTIASYPQKSNDLDTNPREVQKRRNRKKIPTPKWQKHLSNNLLRFHPPETRVIIKTEKISPGFDKSIKDFQKIVLITFLKNSNESSSFHALVNTKNGKIIKTWDRTINERIRAKELTMTPTGLIYRD